MSLDFPPRGGCLARERRSCHADAEVASCCIRADIERRHRKANRPSCVKRRRGGSDGQRDGSRMLSAELGLAADHPRVGETPGLRRGDHRTGERARSAQAPRSGSMQSCDGHPRPAGAGGRDRRACRVRGGGDRRAAGPCTHVQRRRPHDAEARKLASCTSTNDPLNHGVAPRNTKDWKRQIAPPTLLRIV